jgi:hypothetical protein
MGSLIITKLVLSLMQISLDFQDVFLIITDLVVEGVLLCCVGSLQFIDFLPIELSQPVNLL